ncbi:hypothetical protein COCNU_scaffold014789G000040 [Cocos nucifera]|nr:hypothetical protein [Cocos nucifera]
MNTPGGPNLPFGLGRSKAKFQMELNTGITFDDVAGLDETKQDFKEIVEFLKSVEKFAAVGARIPMGVRLVGPPGSRKTLLAKAITGEAGVPFFSLSGTGTRGNDEREQTLNQLHTEMDGFSGDSGVIALAAMNQQHILDSASLRPGRFDRKVRNCCYYFCTFSDSFQMIATFGMSEIRPWAMMDPAVQSSDVAFRMLARNSMSKKLAEDIHKSVKAIIDNAYEIAKPHSHKE